MHKIVTTVAKLLVATLVGAVLEGCLLRDPWVELGNGYNIGAISRSSPCGLHYFEAMDSRPPSPWRAVRSEGSFEIHNQDTGKLLEYESEEEWRQACGELGARQSGDTLLNHVTGFNRDERYVIGHSNSGGFFLLDKDRDSLETWPEEAPWAKEIRSRTALDPDELLDATSWQLQYRSAGYWTIMGVYAALVLAWLLLPLVPGLKRHDFRFAKRGDG